MLHFAQHFMSISLEQTNGDILNFTSGELGMPIRTPGGGPDIKAQAIREKKAVKQLMGKRKATEGWLGQDISRWTQ
jgi:hypothetical protein